MADGTYRFQQPGAGYYYPQQHNPHQRQHLGGRNGSPPNGRIKYNNDTPSPSRSPPLTQSPAHNAFGMYNQGHQGQHVMMNGGQGHQRYGMPMNFKNHHPHHSQQHHHHQQNQGGHVNHGGIGHQHNFSASGLNSSTPNFAPNHVQNNSNGDIRDDLEEPMNAHWQQQLQLAAESRQANSPHYYARNLAQANKGIQMTSTSIVEEADTQERNRTTVVKENRRQDWMALDFGGQGLKALSEALFHYKFLEKLYLNHNKLERLPPVIGQLKNLVHLDLSSNHLNELPEEIGMLTNLQTLLLFDNNLHSLPYELGYLFKLEVLGIEGNPLDDHLKGKIMQEGTKKLITYLREEMPVQLPPADRDWIVLDETSASSSGPAPDKFTALSYNILCDRMATSSQYGYASSSVLDWQSRRDIILNEIQTHDADIVCLQEVDKTSYDDFFGPKLAYHDYKGTYVQKNRANLVDQKEGLTVDGCATFWKGSKYILLDKTTIHFGSTAVNRRDAKGQDDVYNRVWQKDNVAVIAFLENRTTGSRMIVVNVHIHWDPAFRDVKLIQVALLMDELTELAERFAKVPACTNKAAFRFSDADDVESERIPQELGPSLEYSSGPQMPMLICGDFNSGTDSGVWDLLTTGEVAFDHEDIEGHTYGNFTRDGAAHPFDLKSAYGTIGELSFTNYTPNFTDVIDYIWYSKNSLHVTGLLGEVDKEYLQRVPGFPNYHFPSDHLALLAEFQVKNKKGKVVEADFGSHRDRRT